MIHHGLLAAFLFAVGQPGGATLDKAEARKAFDYLNQIRKNPAKFSEEIGADLSAVKERPQLVWNDTIAKVAEAKALDMANRNYFDHVSPDGIGINIQLHEAGYKLPDRWIKNKKDNYFESIGAGYPTGVAQIRMLILDKDVADLGHRKHLLGTNDFHAPSVDVGIGFARNPNTTFRVYLCLIIARQK